MFQGATDSASGAKRGVAVRDAEDEERLLSKFRSVVTEETQAIVVSFERRFSAIESRQEQLEHRVEELERKVGRVPGGSVAAGTSNSRFSPEFVEIKGFCSWSERFMKGATRADAGELLKLLTPLLPQDLQQHVRPFELRGLRNYSVKVPINPECIREIKGIWSENFKAKRVTGPGECELYVTLQKSPAQRAKYSVMGKLYEYVQKAKPELKFKALWAPDFCIYAEPADGLPVLVASVSSENTVQWENGCQTILGVSPEEASEQLAVHRRV